MIPIELINSTWPPPEQSNGFPKIVLNYDDWNDYNYRTSFGMFFYDDTGMQHEIGTVKIYYYENDEARTKSFSGHTREYINNGRISKLDKNFCSLGQELTYYKNLKELLPKECISVLKRLNDMAVFDDIKERFSNEEGVKTSLLRFSGAEKALKEARNIMHGIAPLEKDISFTYKVQVPYDASPLELGFDFSRSEFLPYRVNFLVGKNGTGKTQILANLANSLSGYTNEKEGNVFINGRPAVDRVLSISYSAFDSFKKPSDSVLFDDSLEFDSEHENTKRRMFSYVYCGIQSQNGTLTLEQLRKNFVTAYDTLVKAGRKEIWREVLSELMETEHRRIIKKIERDEVDEINWSSGQHILICTITELIANIENESIILFDEPEIHLHPNAIANVMRAFYRLLDTFDSYAIFSTHSPIILQEIPSSHIMILEREKNILTVRKPGIECFGSNISDIVSEVFDVGDLESNFKTILRQLSRKLSRNEILDLFDGNLSFGALLFLENCSPRETET